MTEAYSGVYIMITITIYNTANIPIATKLCRIPMVLGTLAGNTINVEPNIIIVL